MCADKLAHFLAVGVLESHGFSCMKVVFSVNFACLISITSDKRPLTIENRCCEHLTSHEDTKTMSVRYRPDYPVPLPGMHAN